MVGLGFGCVMHIDVSFIWVVAAFILNVQQVGCDRLSVIQVHGLL